MKTSRLGQRILDASGRESYSKIAEKLGVKRQTLAGWINGIEPTLESLRSIATYTRTPIEVLIKDLDNKIVGEAG